MSDNTTLIHKKGVCENPDCDLCLSKTVQEVEPGEDFVCSECGTPLKEVKGGKDNKAKKGTGGNNRLIYIIIAAVVVLGGIGTAICLMQGKGDKEVIEEPVGGGVVKSPGSDDPETFDPPITGGNEEPGKGIDDGKTDGKGGNGGGTVTPPDPVSGTATITLAYGVYSGPVKNGKPDDMGGEFKVTKSMTLDLKDGYGSTVDLNPGDKIITTKFTDGKFRQGEIIFADGTHKYVSGLNQSL